MKTLSIIIPIYNVEKYLERCIESILKQDLSQVEIILVNDGSTDKSLSIAKKYKEKYINWILINQKNKGLSGARNTGINAASGQFLWFIDSDDYIIDNAISSLLSVISDNKSINIIATDTNIIYEQDYEHKIKHITRNLPNSGIYLTTELYQKGYIFPFSGATFYIVNRTFLIKNHLFFKEGIYFEDMLYTPLLLSQSTQCYYFKYPLYNYYVRKGSITTTCSTLKKCLDRLGIADDLEKKIHDKQLSAWQRYILHDTIARIIGTYYRYYKALPNHKERMNAKSEYFKRKYLLSSILESKKYKYVLRILMMKLL